MRNLIFATVLFFSASAFAALPTAGIGPESQITRQFKTNATIFNWQSNLLTKGSALPLHTNSVFGEAGKATTINFSTPHSSKFMTLQTLRITENGSTDDLIRLGFNAHQTNLANGEEAWFWQLENNFTDPSGDHLHEFFLSHYTNGTDFRPFYVDLRTNDNRTRIRMRGEVGVLGETNTVQTMLMPSHGDIRFFRTLDINTSAAGGRSNLFGLRLGSQTTSSTNAALRFYTVNVGDSPDYAGIELAVHDSGSGVESGGLDFYSRNAGAWGHKTRFAYNGFWGFGTNNPQDMVHIHGDARIALNRSLKFGNGLNGQILHDGSFYIDNLAGNLNLYNRQATTVFWQSSLEKMRIDGEGVTIQNGVAAELRFAGADTANIYQSSAFPLYINTTNNSSIILGASNSGSEAMRIMPSGNIGIGTNNPNDKLHVAGGIVVDTTTNAEITFIGANPASLYQSVSGGSLFLNTLNGGPIVFGAGGAGSENVRVNTVGLGVKTNDPQAALHVHGDARFAGGAFRIETNNAAGYVLTSDATGIGSWQPAASAVFASTADSTVPADATTETSLFGTGVGSLTIAANTWTVGKTLRVNLKGQFNSDGETLTVKVKIGGTDVTVSKSLAGTDAYWELVLDATCRSTGAGGSIMIAGRFSDNTGGLQVLEIFSSQGLDTTAGKTIDITGDWTTNNGGDSIVCNTATVEFLR